MRLASTSARKEIESLMRRINIVRREAKGKLKSHPGVYEEIKRFTQKLAKNL